MLCSPREIEFLISRMFRSIIQTRRRSGTEWISLTGINSQVIAPATFFHNSTGYG